MNKNKLLEDLLTVTGSAFTTFVKANNKVFDKIKTKVDPNNNSNNYVSREEFETLLEMIMELKRNQETLFEKIKK
jgi:BMFP domain-containing protein YqiC